MITADQILCHLVGDYILQSSWMAHRKTSNWDVALLHAFFYMLPFLFLGPSPVAILVISLTHAAIDRYRLAKYIVVLHDKLAPKVARPRPAERGEMGFPGTTPVWLSTWLLIIIDNTTHVLINGLALRYL